MRSVLAVLSVFSLLAAAGILQRISGWAVAISFGAWMFYTQGYGYVAHDHMALVIAAFVLPTIGNWFMYFVALAIGSVVGMLMLAILKKPANK